MRGEVNALAPAPGGSIAEGTRTFLFADLRDYTAFVERHGDRIAADLVAAYRTLIRQRVRETSGAEIKVEGDAMFVVFPSARQAIACGAAILNDAAVRTQAQPDLPMRVGIGLHAGEPVAQDDDFIGSAVNVAARIGAAAGAGQLLISDVVRALVRTGAPFPMRDRGPVTLKGLSEPVRLYEVVWSDVSPTDSAALIEGSLIPCPQPPRFEAPGSPLVGRDDELALLRSRVAALSSNPPPLGEGRVGATGGTVMIAGDAGIGKSRLLREALFGSASALLYGACGISEAPPPYEPFVAIVRSIIREPNGEAGLQGVIPELLALVPESAASRQQAPDRDRIFGAFLRLLRQYARARPTVLVVEDLHWADEATLAMLQFLIGEAEPTPYLVAATYRSDELHRRHRIRPFLAALARRADVVTISLPPLPAAHALELLQGLPTLKAASASEMEAINHRAEGNPLFLEELAETHQLGRSAVPASVAETVLQRVARAGDNAGRLLQYLAVTGARANYDILEPLMGEEAALLEGARAGVEEHLVQEDDDGLAFRHALIREAILSDLMTRERRALHRSVGEAMERLHKDDPEYAGDIAQHLGAAGLADRALTFAMKAGERALRLAAAEEAARIYEHAVEWSQPSTVDRMRALEGLGRAYARDLFVKKATATYQEALDLARSIGSQDDVARITLRRTFVLPWGREEYASWQASWAAAEPLDQPATLARIASGLARRAYLYLEDDRGAAWVKRALVEARRAGGRGQELFALRLQLQYQHRPGWQAEEEAHIREQLELALWDDDGVLSMYTDFYVRRCRDSDEAEREQILQTGRDYADRLAIPEGIVFRYGVAWVNWLTGRWDRARALSDLIRSRWSDDAPVVYPSVGPIAASVAIEIDGPEAGRRQLTDATARLRKTETWRALLWAAAHEANLHLAEGRAAAVLESFRPIFEPRPPSLYDVEDFALASRVVLPAALLAGDRRVLSRWIDDPTVAAGGAIYQAAVDHARAIVALLDGNRTAADASFARASAAYLERGWLLLAHELAWQWSRTGSPAASQALRAAVTFYEAQGATWRLGWLAERRDAEGGGA